MPRCFALIRYLHQFNISSLLRMGNFFCRNKIHPDGRSVDEILSSAHSSRSLWSSKQHEACEREMLKQLQDEGIVPKVKEGGLSFDVGFSESKPAKKPPSRLAKLQNKPAPETIVYTADEKQLIAEILREDQLANKTHPARVFDNRVDFLKAAKKKHQ